MSRTSSKRALKVTFLVIAAATVSEGTSSASSVGSTVSRELADDHFAMAQAYVADGNPDRAIEEFKLVLVHDPKSAIVHNRLAQEYVKKGLLSSALESCKEALRLDPKHVDTRLMLAGIYASLKDTNSALAEYDRVLSAQPSNEEAAVYRAQLLIEEDQGQKAARQLEAFAKRNPESPLVLYYLGRAEQRNNHWKEARKAYERALTVRPHFTQAGLALGYLYEEKGMHTEAIAAYRRLFDRNQDVGAANRIATILLKQEKYKDAIPYLESISQQDPDDLNVRVKLGLVQMELKEFDRAIQIFKAILAKNPESDRIHYYLGSIYEERKQFDLAVSELKQIRSESKLFTDSAVHVSFLLKQMGRMEEAKTSIAESIGRSPKTVQFYLFQASLEEETKNLSGALGVLEAAVKLFPEDEKLRYYLGSLFDRAGDTDKSLEHMETLLRINPENADALNYIGYTWTVRGVRLNDAERLLRQAVHLKPDNGYIQDSWGYHLLVRGRMREAIAQLEIAAKLRPKEATILEHLGDAYRKHNLNEKALNQYREAAKVAEDEEIRRKIEAKATVLDQELVQGGRRPASVAPSAPAKQ